jgi:uncharacterized protein YecE (DUF72 family)
MARVLVGTSGWSYASWRGPFFPTGLPAKRQLEYYASQFETVERAMNPGRLGFKIRCQAL